MAAKHHRSPLPSRQRTGPSLTAPHAEHGQAPAACDHYDLLIIGAGPAGLAAARGAAAAGVRVALIESHHIGGNCLHEGCIPSKTIIRSAQLLAEMRNAPNYGVETPADRAPPVAFRV